MTSNASPASPSSAPADRASVASFTRLAIVLGLLTAVGPFAIDMYLPALPSLARELAASPHAAQATLATFFVALGAGQLVAGPLSDRFGRRVPMLVGLAVFAAASIGCAMAGSIEQVIAMRFLQGLGACACMVTPRAIVRDLYEGAPAARLMSLLLTIYSVSPILAPLFGSAVAARVGWRGVFVAIALLALAAAVLVVRRLPETRPPEARRGVRLRDAFAGYRVLLTDGHFIALAVIASSSVASFFVFVANSSFVYSGHFGVTPDLYALLFALNAVVFVVVSQFNGRLVARFGVRRVVRVATVLQAAIFVVLFVAFVTGIDALVPLVIALACGYGLNSVIVPSCFVLAMERHGARAGSASALLGTFNFAGGALVVALVAPWTDGTAVPMLAGIAACGVAAAVVAGLRLRAAPAR